MQANAQMQEQLSQAGDSVRQMVLLRDTINERDMVITQLKMNINNLERDRYEVQKQNDGLQTELTERSTQLEKSRDQLKTLMMEKSSLTQQTREQEV